MSQARQRTGQDGFSKGRSIAGQPCQPGKAEEVPVGLTSMRVAIFVQDARRPGSHQTEALDNK